ncbi:photosystem reaction center subunit H [Salipiger aestuarii]|uniref:PRC-barrel domain protein n=1 Tax=Salipiger aestuarii TaxID=568098 RepID=A0A327YKI2_9RHOB|nr:PRC-barrel domain-containing protein [Salipiger aestuarii]KAB2542454.1 photosystem reaction center subunit H [Salipiger aestuarii]RAK18789.1 PRC-barrel domain protein [Salipiger aestuarii]
MLYSLTDLLTWKLDAEAEGLVLSDLVFDAGSGRLVYVSLSTGRDSEGQALAPAALLGAPDPASRSLPMRITEKELSDAPRWTGETYQVDSLVSAMPPLVVGPFGATHAPLALAAFLPSSDDEDRPTDPRAEAALDRYDRLGRWLDRPVFGSDAEMGHLADMLWDPQANRIAYLVIGRGGFFSSRRHAVPFSALSYRAPGAKGGHLVLDLPASALDAAPAPDSLLGGE